MEEGEVRHFRIVVFKVELILREISVTILNSKLLQIRQSVALQEKTSEKSSSYKKVSFTKENL